MKRLTIPDAETFIAAIQDELSRTREGRYFHRLAVVLHVLRGASAYEASRAFGFPPELSNTGLKDWLPMGLTDFGTESILADLAVFQLRKSKYYEKN